MFESNNDCKIKLNVPTEVNIFNCDDLIYIKPSKMKKRLEIYCNEKSGQEPDLNVLINRFRQLKISKLLKFTGKKETSNNIPAAEDVDLKKIIKSVNKNISKLNKLCPSTSILDKQTKHKFKSIGKATSLPLKKRLSDLHNISSKKHKKEKSKNKTINPKLPHIKQEPIFQETNNIKIESQGKRTKLVKLIQRNLNNDGYKIIDKSPESKNYNKSKQVLASKKIKSSRKKLNPQIEKTPKPTIAIKKEQNSRLTRYQTKYNEQSLNNLNSKTKPYESKVKIVDPLAGSYKKIKSNIYVDIKPFTAYENQACSCKCPINPEDLGCQESCLNRMMYVECDPETCPCGDRCDNQRMQKQKSHPSALQLFATPDRGYGVRTTKPLKSGDFITEYTGEVVSVKEFERRESEDYHGSLHHYCLYIDRRAVIDAYRSGSICRFVNHSCAPNCVMQKWSVKGLPRIALYAKPQNSQGIISAGTELTYDYNFRCFQGRTAQPCLCGSGPGICRGYITTTSTQNGNGHNGNNSNGRNTPNGQENASLAGTPKVKASKKAVRSDKVKKLLVGLPPRSHKKKEPAVHLGPLKQESHPKAVMLGHKTTVLGDRKFSIAEFVEAEFKKMRAARRDVLKERAIAAEKKASSIAAAIAAKKKASSIAAKKKASSIAAAIAAKKKASSIATAKRELLPGHPVAHQQLASNAQSSRALRGRICDSKPPASFKSLKAVNVPSPKSTTKRLIAPLKPDSSKRKRLPDKLVNDRGKLSHKKKDVKGHIVEPATLVNKKSKFNVKATVTLPEVSTLKESKALLPPAKRLRKKGNRIEESHAARKRRLLLTSTPEMIEALRRLYNFYLDKTSPFCIFARALTLTSAATGLAQPHTHSATFRLSCYLKRNLGRAFKSFRALAVVDERLQTLSSVPIVSDESLSSRISTPTSTTSNQEFRESLVDAKPMAPVILLAEIFYLVKNYKNNRLKGWKYVSSPFYHPFKCRDSDRTASPDTPLHDDDQREGGPQAATCFRDIERCLKSEGYESFTAFDADFETMFSAVQSTLVETGTGGGNRLHKPDGAVACKYTLALRHLRQHYAVIVNSRIHALRRTFPRDTIPIKCLLPLLEQTTSHDEEDLDALALKSTTPDDKNHDIHTPTHSHDASNTSCLPLRNSSPDEARPNVDEITDNAAPPASEDDIINCPCRMFREEGTMIQCDKCLTWQHCECVTFPEDRIGSTDKLPQNRSHYQCPACDGTQAPLDVPLCTAIVRDYDNDEAPNGSSTTVGAPNKSTELTYYRTMGKVEGRFRIKCGECYYVIRSQESIQPKVGPSMRENSDGDHKYCENLDIMRVIYLFADRNGQRWAQGHHFFRPGETFHEPSRRFFVNELLQVYVYETVPLDSIYGPCWVLDYGTYCKGRPWVEKVNLPPSHQQLTPLHEARNSAMPLPVEGAVPPFPDLVLPPEDDVYVCQFKVDKLAKAFTKISKLKYAPELSNYTFYSFGTVLKPKRIYFPHEIPRKYASSDPSLWYMRTEALESVKKVLAGAPKSTKKSGNHIYDQTPLGTTFKSDHALGAPLACTDLCSSLSSSTIDAIRDTIPAFVRACNVKRSARLKQRICEKKTRGSKSLEEVLSRLPRADHTTPNFPCNS